MLRNSRYIVRCGRNTFVMWAPFREDARLGADSFVSDLPDSAEWYDGSVAPPGTMPVTAGFGVTEDGREAIPDADECGWWLCPDTSLTVMEDRTLKPLDFKTPNRLFFRRMNQIKYFVDVP